MIGLPIDLEVAVHGWSAAERLREIAARASTAIENTDDLSAGSIAAILGTLLGDIDGVALELESVEVEL